MKRFVKITFIAGLCLRMVLFVTPSLAGSSEDCNEYRDPMTRLACMLSINDIKLTEKNNDYDYTYGDKTDDIDLVISVGDYESLCCNAIDEYESIDCSGKTRWSLWACLYSRIQAKDNVADKCDDANPTGTSQEQCVYNNLRNECDDPSGMIRNICIL